MNAPTNILIHGRMGRRLLGGGGLRWFFWGDSSSLLSAIGLLRDTLGIVRLCDGVCAPLCVEERVKDATSERSDVLGV